MYTYNKVKSQLAVCVNIIIYIILSIIYRPIRIKVSIFSSLLSITPEDSDITWNAMPTPCIYVLHFHIVVLEFFRLRCMLHINGSITIQCRKDDRF
ncbi:hypothetical protein LENED_009792 [Lentinula edodes]|uniref:Uncharacterized protein n=1 Tax=Lentinula edodes TaxID=5353 RepID=A0A1Q3EKQ0_LENED|nr:hypothetical protein LENED_009792 [Lentinula edodes]